MRMALERPALDALRERVVACRRCPELRAYCREVGRAKKHEFAGETYWAKPVPGIGPARPGSPGAPVPP